MSPAEMQRQLNQEADYWGWLRTVVGDNYPNNNMVFATDWLDFAYRQTPSAQTGPSIPWPEQDIQLTCAASPGKALYQYDFATASWAQTFVHPQATDVRNALSSLPDGDGYLVQTASQIILWRDGEESVVYEEKLGNPRVWSFHVSGFDPTGRYLVMVAYIFGEEPMFEYRLIDLERCDRAGCDFWPLPGRPIWSPDGRQALFAVEPGDDVAAVDPVYRAWYFTLYHGDPRAESLVEVGPGNWPAWLDNERYSYSRLRSDEPGGKQEVEVVIARASDHTPQVVLRGADLLNAIPPAERPEQIYPLEAQELATNKNRLLLTAFTSLPSSSSQLTDGPFYHFLLDTAPDGARVEKIVSLLHSDTPSYFVSPLDGRWSAIVVPHDDGRIDSTIHLLNLESGQSIALSSSDLRSIAWSADGQWYLQGYERYLLLVAPEYEYQYLIQHDFLSCYHWRWVSNP
jgi:hypothetical protein